MVNEEFPYKLFELKNFFHCAGKGKKKNEELSSFEDCVLLSRITLSRNLKDEHFPLSVNNLTNMRIMNEILPSVKKCLRTPGKTCYSVVPFELPAGDRNFLKERFFLEWKRYPLGRGSAVCASEDRSTSVYINGRDRILMQVTGQGICTDKLLEKIMKLDRSMGKVLPWAFDQNLGYLTSSPSELGTAMHVRYTLYIPGLALTNSISSLRNSLDALGIHFYDEWIDIRSEDLSSCMVYEISNVSTLGESEEEIAFNMEKLARRIALYEENAVQILLNTKRGFLLDKISNAYGSLCHSYQLSINETIRSLSLILLGVKLNMFRSFNAEEIADLYFLCQDGHLQLKANKDLSEEELLSARAELLRDFFNRKNRRQTAEK